MRFAEYVAILSVGNRTGTYWKNKHVEQANKLKFRQRRKVGKLLQGICTNVNDHWEIMFL